MLLFLALLLEEIELKKNIKNIEKEKIAFIKKDEEEEKKD
jgi:hypothetical protein